jgi:hypothetical protein
MLRKVVEGLAKEPVLLFGFATLLVVAVVGQVLGGNLMPAGWVLLGVYMLTVCAWLAVRRPRKAPVASAKSRVSVDDGTKDVKIHDSGNVRHASSQSESTIEVHRAEGVEIKGSGNIGFDLPPTRDI